MTNRMNFKCFNFKNHWGKAISPHNYAEKVV